MIRRVRVTGGPGPTTIKVTDAETGQDIACSSVELRISFADRWPRLMAKLEMAVEHVDLDALRESGGS